MRSARFTRGATLPGWLLAGLLAAAGPAGAQGLETSIDLGYTYEQEHLGGIVSAATGFQQKYQLRLSTTLTSSLDLSGAIGVDLDDKWDTDAATTSNVSPSLELGLKGPQSAAKFNYTATINRTEAFREVRESTQYSNSGDLSVELTPTFWPELKFKLLEKRDYERATTETSNRTLELQLRHDFYEVLSMDFSLKLDTAIDELPERTLSDGVDWSWKATYKEELLGGLDFELAYEVTESYAEDSTRGVFSSLSEDYSQSLKTRLKKSLEFSSRLSAGVSWEYSFEQDLLKLEYDYKVQNKYSFDVRYDVLSSLKITADAKRETEQEEGIVGEDDTSKCTDTLKAAFDFEPTKWLRLGGKGELKFDDAIEEDTGGSVDGAEDREYELTLKNKFGDFWDLTVSTGSSWSYTEDVLEEREAKFKTSLKLQLLRLGWADVKVEPSYEATRNASWDELGFEDGESSTGDARFKFEFRSQLLGVLKATFSHEYGQKIKRETDRVGNFERELGFNETTRLSVNIENLVEDLKLEGEVERKADDTEDDAEEQVVVVSYALKLDWKYEGFSLSSGFKYNDKGGEEDDDLEFTAKLGWTGDRLDVSGDYQFVKTYADLTDEDRKLNLKLSYKF